MRTRDFHNQSLLSIFLSYFRPHMGLFVLDMACALMISLIDLAFPYVSRMCMYDLIPESRYQAFFAVVVVMVAAYLLRSALQYAHIVSRFYSADSNNRLRNILFIFSRFSGRTNIEILAAFLGRLPKRFYICTPFRVRQCPRGDRRDG